jgi:hypothetical protein
MNRTLMIGGFAALSAVAVAGWLRPAPQNLNAAEPLPAIESQSAYRPVEYRQPAYQQPARRAYTPQPAYRDIDDGYRARSAYNESPAPVYKRPRTKTKSALIIGGSAATGAAIGAIAGGGKGAGIGALSGGAAGFIYDALTRNK